MVFVGKIILRKKLDIKKLQFQTILFPSEKKTEVKKIESPSLLPVLFSVSINKLPWLRVLSSLDKAQLCTLRPFRF